VSSFYEPWTRNANNTTLRAYIGAYIATQVTDTVLSYVHLRLHIFCSTMLSGHLPLGRVRTTMMQIGDQKRQSTTGRTVGWSRPCRCLRWQLFLKAKQRSMSWHPFMLRSNLITCVVDRRQLLWIAQLPKARPRPQRKRHPY
jgi:hypothetical protein